MESSVKQISGNVKQIKNKLEILESKTDIMDREKKRELDNLAPLGTEEEFCLRLRRVPENSGEDTREKVIKALAGF